MRKCRVSSSSNVRSSSSSSSTDSSRSAGKHARLHCVLSESISQVFKRIRTTGNSSASSSSSLSCGSSWNSGLPEVLMDMVTTYLFHIEHIRAMRTCTTWRKLMSRSGFQLLHSCFPVLEGGEHADAKPDIKRINNRTVEAQQRRCAKHTKEWSMHTKCGVDFKVDDVPEKVWSTARSIVFLPPSICEFVLCCSSITTATNNKAADDKEENETVSSAQSNKDGDREKKDETLSRKIRKGLKRFEAKSYACLSFVSPSVSAARQIRWHDRRAGTDQRFGFVCDCLSFAKKFIYADLSTPVMLHQHQSSSDLTHMCQDVGMSAYHFDGPIRRLKAIMIRHAMTEDERKHSRTSTAGRRIEATIMANDAFGIEPLLKRHMFDGVQHLILPYDDPKETDLYVRMFRRHCNDIRYVTLYICPDPLILLKEERRKKTSQSHDKTDAKINAKTDDKTNDKTNGKTKVDVYVKIMDLVRAIETKATFLSGMIVMETCADCRDATDIMKKMISKPRLVYNSRLLKRHIAVASSSSASVGELTRECKWKIECHGCQSLRFENEKQLLKNEASAARPMKSKSDDTQCCSLCPPWTNRHLFVPACLQSISLAWLKDPLSRPLSWTSAMSTIHPPASFVSSVSTYRDMMLLYKEWSTSRSVFTFKGFSETVDDDYSDHDVRHGPLWCIQFTFPLSLQTISTMTKPIAIPVQLERAKRFPWVQSFQLMDFFHTVVQTIIGAFVKDTVSHDKSLGICFGIHKTAQSEAAKLLGIPSPKTIMSSGCSLFIYGDGEHLKILNALLFHYYHCHVDRLLQTNFSTSSSTLLDTGKD